VCAQAALNDHASPTYSCHNVEPRTILHAAMQCQDANYNSADSTTPSFRAHLLHSHTLAFSLQWAVQADTENCCASLHHLLPSKYYPSQMQVALTALGTSAHAA
jgi:hypothetical protein